MAKKITYLEAKENDKLKQAYLDSIMQHCPESVQALVYDPDWSNRNSYLDLLIAEGYVFINKTETLKGHLNEAYFIVLFPHLLIGKGRKSPIFVSNKGFEKTKTEAHFLNSLLDHETVHTDDLMYGIRPKKGICINHYNINQVSPTIITNLEEVLAYRNQFKKFKEKGINDPSFECWLKWQISTYEYDLYSIKPQTELERIVIG